MTTKELLIAATMIAIGIAAPRPAEALPRTWVGGNSNWDDGGSIGFWNPTDEPDPDDEAIFNTSNAVSMGNSNSIAALTMSAGIDLSTAGHDLTVDGLIQLVNASTILDIGGGTSTVQGDSVTINSGGVIRMTGGDLRVTEESGDGLLDLNTGGTLSGYGSVHLDDAPAGVATLLTNDGTITASHPSAVLFGDPPVDKLAFTIADSNGRFDLDGSAGGGVLNVQRNQTLTFNGTVGDPFSGLVNLFQNATLDISSPWTVDSGSIVADNGLVDNVFPIPDVPAGTSTIAGGALTLEGGTINVTDVDGVLQFDAPLVMNSGTLSNSGLVIFNANATVAAAADFNPVTAGASFTIGAGRTVVINQTIFNFDGPEAGTSQITVSAGGTLTLNVTDYDSDAATNSFGGVITLNNGVISVTSGSAEFVMDGVLNSSASGSDQSLWTGEPLDIGNDAGSLDADVSISGNQPTQFGAQVDFNSDADLNVADGATAHFLAVVNFNPVNGGNNAEFTGAGELIFSAGVNFSETTHLNMVGGTVDLDGADSVGDTINIDAPLTINAELMRSFGKTNGGGGTNLLDVNNSVSTGVLTVNLDGADAEWTLNAQGVMNLVNDNTDATLLAGSDVNVNGTVNVTGDVRTTARVDIGSTAIVNINTAGQPLRLAGGTTNDHNVIAGGTISGAGILGADTARALHGFGTINTAIDFDGTANLRADDGTLTINGAIIDVNIIGTDDEDGVLNIPAAWNNNVAAAISLLGGALQGGTITNDTGNGIQGFGAVTARVINNSKLLGGNGGGTLLFETAGNDNDWDGTTDTGELFANAGALLELRDVGAAFGFGGTVGVAPGGRVFTNGFALDFNPGSDLILSSGAYESTNSTDIGGTVTVEAGGQSTIIVEENRFLSFESGSTTTLGSNLRLLNNNIIIEAGASFSGAGALIIPDNSNVVLDATANVNTLVINEGAIRPANSDGVGQVFVKDYQQASTGELYLDLTGTNLNAYDRVTVNGDAMLGGYLEIDIDGGFVPVVGNTFNILSTTGIRSGTFGFVDVMSMPPGLTFHINYLPNGVQLEVVNTPFYSADFDDDGDVDPTDFDKWKKAVNLNSIGDADGDNDSDGFDFLIWQRQFGSIPAVAVADAVPEPTGAIQAAVVMVGLVVMRRTPVYLWRRR